MDSLTIIYSDVPLLERELRLAILFLFLLGFLEGLAQAGHTEITVHRRLPRAGRQFSVRDQLSIAQAVPDFHGLPVAPRLQKTR